MKTETYIIIGGLILIIGFILLFRQGYLKAKGNADKSWKDLEEEAKYWEELNRRKDDNN